MLENVSRLACDGRLVRLTQAGRQLDERVKHGLQIERRAADDLEHVGGGGLLLQGFAQFAEEPLHRQVSRLLALEDAIDVACCASELIALIRTIGHQATAGDIVAERINRGQPQLCRQLDDQVAMRRNRRASRDYQAAVGAAHEGRYGALDLTLVAHIDCAQFDTKRRCDSLDSGKLAYSSSNGRIPNYGRPGQIRRKLLEQLQPLGADAVLKHCKSGRVAARPRQALDIAGTNRVGDSSEDDRHGAGRLQ